MSFRKTLIKTGMAVRKYTPQILAFIGTVSTIGGVVLACKESAESADDIKEAKEEVQEIKEALEKKENKDEIKECKKQIRSIRWKTVKKVGPRFILPLGMIGGGLSALHASRMIVTYALNAASTAYISLENRYQMLEDGVRQEYGEEALERLKYGLYEGSAEIRTVDQDGIEKARMEAFNDLVDPDKVGKYTFILDKSSNRHINDADHLLSYLKTLQDKVFTPWLKKNGALSLLDVCHTLDIHPKSIEEYLFMRNTYWVYEPTKREKDCYVDLRAKVLHDGKSKNYKNGYDPVIIIDPNWDTHVTNGDYSEVFKALR